MTILTNILNIRSAQHGACPSKITTFLWHLLIITFCKARNALMPPLLIKLEAILTVFRQENFETCPNTRKV